MWSPITLQGAMTIFYVKNYHFKGSHDHILCEKLPLHRQPWPYYMWSPTTSQGAMTIFYVKIPRQLWLALLPTTQWSWFQILFQAGISFTLNFASPHYYQSSLKSLSHWHSPSLTHDSRIRMHTHTHKGIWKPPLYHKGIWKPLLYLFLANYALSQIIFC